MKYCVKCGAEMLDEAVICTKCGCLSSDNRLNIEKKSNRVKYINSKNNYNTLLPFILGCLSLIMSIILWVNVIINSAFILLLATLFNYLGFGCLSIIAIIISVKNIVNEKHNIFNLLGLIFATLSMLSNIWNVFYIYRFL